MSAHRVIGPPVVPGTLYVGSYPPTDLRADVLVLCARELQAWTGATTTVWRVPLDDSGAPMTALERSVAVDAGRGVARLLRLGKTVVSSCAQGRNRSGLVAALALVDLGLRPEVAVGLVREARAPRDALANDEFVRLIFAAASNRSEARA